MSVICQTFVQNAWRSDLCSNCFKCREEHDSSTRCSTSGHRYMPQATSLYQSRGISTSLKWRLSEPIYERVARRDFGSQTLVRPRIDNRRGILVTAPQDRRRRSRSSVDFASEEALVIGYGGNDYDSDQSPWEMGSDDGSVDLDLLDDNDEDRKITRATRNNTEFNSYNRNLSLPPDDKSKDKKNAINNNKTAQKTPDRSLDILTHNDIQSHQKKQLNHYYFPSSTEQHSFLHGGNKVVNVNEQSNKTINVNEQGNKVVNVHEQGNKVVKVNEQDNKVVKMNEQSNKIVKMNEQSGKFVNVNEKTNVHSPEFTKLENHMGINKENGSKNLLRDDFTPLNTKTYSFVSELSKNGNLCSEHSSDSDYSTCRLTAGDSTDSESFQDAEESRILPCSSFLHGSFPPQQKVVLQQSLSSLESDKKYDAGSSTSGDVSNLSDDSDASERAPYKSRNARSPKTSPTDARRSCNETSSVSEKKPSIPTNSKHSESEKLPREKTETSKADKATFNKSEKKQTPEGNTSPSEKSHKNTEPISTSVHSKHNPKILDNKTAHSPPPNPPIDVNLRNIIAINGSPATPKESATPDGQPTVTKSSKSSSPKSPEKQEATRKNSSETTIPEKKYQSPNSQAVTESADESFYKEPSDDDDYERSPEAINNRQSKLAALALELELARRDSAMKSNSNRTPPSLPASSPPETKTPTVETYSTIKQGSAISCASRLNPLPDVLQETPTKSKKGRFSLKKLLKRNKESGTFAPAAKESNPKAWKRQAFDRSRLSLEIVHPMDLPPTSGESTPTEEGRYVISSHPGRGIFRGGGYSRARSLSALPLVDPLQENCSLLECRRTDTLPARKAGTVAERKKNRPSLVRTPSCSAIPNRPGSAQQQNSPEQRTPPPKPPPPPKHKVMHPPPPPPPHHPHPRTKAPATPQRPPPPKIPEEKCRTPSGDSSKQDSDKEYANLGDIRSLLTPVKPQRPSAVSAHPRDSSEKEHRSATYEQPQHEEDHYTYLDDTEVRSPRKSPSCSSVISSTNSFKQLQLSSGDRGRPWLDLQTSYAAIAAANYESLTEIITTSLNETVECFRNAGKSLKWKDFILESEEPQIVLHNRCVYNGIYKLQEKEKIMLMVIPRKQCAPQSPRLQPRFPVLATFADHAPSPSGCPEWSSVHVLRRSRLLSVGQLSRESAADDGNQPSHLRDHCFLLLQLIHALKALQAEGVEEVGGDLQALAVVAAEDGGPPPVLVLLPEDKAALCEGGGRTLCQATLDALLHFLQVGSVENLPSCRVNGSGLPEPVAHTFRAIATALAEEKASSLSQAKGLLEHMLWGPVDLAADGDDGSALQRWLDLQRAQMVRSAVSQLQGGRSQLHVYEEYQLVFLLQATVKSLKGVMSRL